MIVATQQDDDDDEPGRGRPRDENVPVTVTDRLVETTVMTAVIPPRRLLTEGSRERIGPASNLPRIGPGPVLRVGRSPNCLMRLGR